ncbi:MAG: division plane positioning ATPase MipZ [Alphaproteobacteria bacterium]
MTEHRKSHVIVLGNEKGGTGKSTISMHLIVQLLELGFKVGSIDIDARQGTLSRYMDNRKQYCEANEIDLLMPTHFTLHRSQNDSVKHATAEEREQFDQTMAQLADCDFIVVDTPGNDTHQSRYAHSFADTLITPINDSFIDLDVLVRIKDIANNQILPSTYAETVWNQKKERLMRDKVSMDWIVMRNRLSSIHARNKEEMWQVLQLLSKRIGFRSVPGFGERVIFRELFLSGMTLLDFQRAGLRLSVSHVAARNELRNMISMLQLPRLQESLEAAS